MKEFVHLNYFVERRIIALKEAVYCTFLLFIMWILLTLIELLIKIFFKSFTIQTDFFWFVIAFMFFYLMIVDKTRIGFIENWFSITNYKHKRYKNFELWFEGMEKFGYTKKEVEEYNKKIAKEEKTE